MDQPFAEPEELRGLIALGRERGYLTFEQIATTLEEVEVTKEQVSGLHAHLVEHRRRSDRRGGRRRLQGSARGGGQRRRRKKPSST